MLVLTWNRCCVVVFLVATLKTGTSQVSEARPKANLIKPGLSEETPTAAPNRSVTVHTGITKKYNILAQVIDYLEAFTHSLRLGILIRSTGIICF